MVDQLRQRRRTADAAGLPATSHREAPTDAKPRHSPRARPRTAAVVLGSLLFYASALAAVSHWHQWLPRPLGVDAPAARFSEGRARLVLGEIMRLGYRPVGSRANEELVPAYLLAEIEAIKAAAGDGVALEIDVQRPSGAFGLDFMAQFQNIYANVTNVLVRVSAKGVPIEHSLLISSHYDAAIGGAAGSDDGVNVAIMIELLRLAVLSPPKHAALVFNFNGAEETIMQAAHGFITSHPWTETIRAFINLEAAGAGGRELLFQTGSDELALAYAHGAKYPHGSIIGQELFQSGVLPAETDYRVYRDFGEVAGMDFAYIANGYVYHTHLDDESRIQPGAIQRLGDNLVGVIEHLANRPGKLAAIAATPHSSNTLFFDVAGIFMVTASKTTTFAVSGLVLAFAVLYFVLLSPVSLMERVQALTLQFKCAGAALGAALAVSVLMTLFAPLAWYSTPVLAAALYVSPAVAGMLHCLSTFVSKRSKSSSGTADALSVPSTTQWRLEESMFDAVLLLWSVLLAVMLSVGLMSSYLLAIWIAFPLLGQCVSGALRSVGSLSPSIYLVVSFASLAAPVVLTMFTFALAVIFLLPLMGRAGSQVPSDIVVAVLFWAMLTVLLSFAGRLFCFVSPKQLRSLRNTFVLITLAAIAFASVRNPYTDECPKRVMVQHVYREVTLPSGEVKTDSGLWVNPLDFRGLEPMRPFLSGTQWHETQLAPTALREEFRIYGDLPWSLPVKSMLPAEKSWYLTTAPPVLPPDQPEARLEVLSSTYSSETDRRKIHLRFSGPSHMNLFIDAKATRLTSWSIGNGTHGPVPEADDAYILQLCSGTPPANFHFWLEAESARPIDVVFVGHYIEVVTPEMAEFMGAMPSWFAFMSCASTLSSMQI